MINSLVSAFLVGASFLSSNPALAEQIDGPAYQIGDSWDFQEVDDWSNNVSQEDHFEVTGSLGDFVRLRETTRVRNPGNNQMENRTPDVLSARADMNTDYVGKDGSIQHRVNYSWPLTVGKSWTYDYEAPNQVNNQTYYFQYRMSAQVVGWETVTTPAGVFRALKIVHQGKSTNQAASASPGYRVAWTYWYAPEVKRAVKSVVQTDTVSGAPNIRMSILMTAYKPAPH